MLIATVGTVPTRNQISCDASDEAIPRYGSVVRRREDDGCARSAVCYSVASPLEISIANETDFCSRRYHPSPFFVLDEVDAALDATNVGRIARYCKSKLISPDSWNSSLTFRVAELAKPEFQFIVISLKVAFYENAAALVGIYRDGGSKTLTLDVSSPFRPSTSSADIFVIARAIRRVGLRCSVVCV